MKQWKPGQIVTWHGKRYRIKRTVPLGCTCYSCSMSFERDCFCIITRHPEILKLPSNCYFELINVERKTEI